MLPFSDLHHPSSHIHLHPNHHPPHPDHDSSDDLDEAPYAYAPAHGPWIGPPESPHDSYYHRSPYVVSFNPDDTPSPDEHSIHQYATAFGTPCTNYAEPPYNFGAYPCASPQEQCPTPPTSYASQIDTHLLPDASAPLVDQSAYINCAPHSHYHAYDSCSAGIDSENVSSPPQGNSYYYEGSNSSAAGSPLPYNFQYLGQPSVPSPPQSTFSELRDALREPEIPKKITSPPGSPVPSAVYPLVQCEEPPMAALCPPDGLRSTSTPPAVSSLSPPPPVNSSISMPTLPPLPQMRSEHFRAKEDDPSGSPGSPPDPLVRKRPKVSTSLPTPSSDPEPLSPTSPLTPHDPDPPAPRRKPKLKQSVDKSPPASGTLTNRRTVRKKPALACLFCRERKIACGPPAPEDEDQTCAQCAKRARKCEMPEKSRRGQYQRLQRESRGQGGSTLPNDPQSQPVASTSTSAFT